MLTQLDRQPWSSRSMLIIGACMDTAQAAGSPCSSLSLVIVCPHRLRRRRRHFVSPSPPRSAFLFCLRAMMRMAVQMLSRFRGAAAAASDETLGGPAPTQE